MWKILFMFLPVEAFASQDVEIKARSLGRNQGHGVSYGNFLLHANSYLEAEKVMHKQSCC